MPTMMPFPPAPAASTTPRTWLFTSDHRNSAEETSALSDIGEIPKHSADRILAPLVCFPVFAAVAILKPGLRFLVVKERYEREGM
jgi:hypothetical protein